MPNTYFSVTPCMPDPLAVLLRPGVVISVPARIRVMVSPAARAEVAPLMPTLTVEDVPLSSVSLARPFTVNIVSLAANVVGR